MSSNGFCESCGQLSKHLQASLCPACHHEDRSDYWKIRNYLVKNPYANAIEISDETNIPISKITSLIKGKAFSVRS